MDQEQDKQPRSPILSITPHPQFRHRNLWIFLGIITLIILIGIYFLRLKSNKISVVSPSSQPILTITPTYPPQPPLSSGDVIEFIKIQEKEYPTTDWAVKEKQTARQMKYTSTELGISFNFLSRDTEFYPVYEIYVLRSKNKICTTHDVNDHECRKGQSIEIFEKNPDQTLTDAIYRTILKNYPKNECFVSALTDDKYKNTNKVEYASISFLTPTSLDPTAPDEINVNCPVDYRLTNGVRYFELFKDHPNKFVFFNLGQYPLVGDLEKQLLWYETFKFIK